MSKPNLASLHLTDVVFRFPKKPASVRAFLVVTFNGVLRVTGMRIIQKADGSLFVSYPAKNKGGEKYHPICFLIDRELSDRIQAEILERFRTLQ